MRLDAETAVRERVPAAALPFVADDPFINFDGGRTAAGLKALASLAEKTQVLFFTRHSHPVDLSRETLGPETSAVTRGTGSRVASAIAASLRAIGEAGRKAPVAAGTGRERQRWRDRNGTRADRIRDVTPDSVPRGPADVRGPPRLS